MLCLVFLNHCLEFKLEKRISSFASNHHDHHQNIKVICFYNLPLFDDDNISPEIEIQASNVYA
ncbi:hypothetical protein GmHk_12G034639 [Glycine max]|nr:hypothetical protein GmHk_12G034639 [Glycine max]